MGPTATSNYEENDPTHKIARNVILSNSTFTFIRFTSLLIFITRHDGTWRSSQRRIATCCTHRHRANNSTAWIVRLVWDEKLGGREAKHILSLANKGLQPSSTTWHFAFSSVSEVSSLNGAIESYVATQEAVPSWDRQMTIHSTVMEWPRSNLMKRRHSMTKQSRAGRSCKRSSALYRPIPVLPPVTMATFCCCVIFLSLLNSAQPHRMNWDENARADIYQQSRLSRSKTPREDMNKRARKESTITSLSVD